jgi:endonuclease VIII-like 1
MPELAEVRLTADYVNRMVEKKTFLEVRKNPSHKGKLFEHPDSFRISAVSRGKEFKLLLEHSGGTEHLLMTMGMSGYFKVTPTGEEIKHSHLMFDASDGTTLSFVDVRRFGKWSFNDWNKDRGPDPVNDKKGFIDYVMSNVNKPAFSKPLHEVLMNQKYFNGIGNYLRAEIIYKLVDVDPFQPARDAILSDPEEEIYWNSVLRYLMKPIFWVEEIYTPGRHHRGSRFTPLWDLGPTGCSATETPQWRRF